ncbi:MAG: hypothetical protein CFE21_02060 [Bacteroidetes bacterium B1(2017)]|nr:MAG: hypothetical protein CFE21_02060 [Bacteroidetes bacterium B1(2017)]
MFAKQFISNEIFPLKKSDSAESALLFMEDWQVKQLPIVESGKVVGFVREKSLLDKEDQKVELLMDQQTEVYTVHEHTHIFEIWGKMNTYEFNTLAVVNADTIYQGVISVKDLSLVSFAHSALTQEGSIIVIEVSAIQYSVAEISRICESNEAKIIHLMIESLKDADNTLHVSIKLNKLYLTHVLASLERFGYSIVYTNSPTDPNHSLDDRYTWLVKYLNT